MVYSTKTEKVQVGTGKVGNKAVIGKHVASLPPRHSPY